MEFVISLIKIFFILAAILCIGVIFFGSMKYIKRKYYPTWKFPDYISVGYAEYLYKKYIKRSI